MGRTIPKPDRTSQREQLGDVRPRPAKASLKPPPDQANSEQKTQTDASYLRDLASEAIRSASGNMRAAAIEIDIHEAHLSRLLKEGTLRLEQMEALGPIFAAKFGQHLVERFGSFASPKAQARRAVRDLRRLADELEAVIEHVA